MGIWAHIAPILRHWDREERPAGSLVMQLCMEP